MPFVRTNSFKWQIADGQSTALKSAAAGKNRSASRRSNQFSPPVCPSLRTWLSPFAIPDHPGRLSSSRSPPRGSDAPECKRRCCFSRAHPAPSSTQDSSFHVSQRAYPYSLGSGPQGFPAFLGLRDKSAIHTPSLILSSHHLLFSSAFGIPIAACRNAQGSAVPTRNNADSGAMVPHSTHWESGASASRRRATFARLACGGKLQRPNRSRYLPVTEWEPVSEKVVNQDLAPVLRLKNSGNDHQALVQQQAASSIRSPP